MKMEEEGKNKWSKKDLGKGARQTEQMEQGRKKE
jgi:hypothetical protein